MAKTLESIVQTTKRLLANITLAATVACATYSGGIIVPHESNPSKKLETINELRREFNLICEKYQVTLEDFYCDQGTKFYRQGDQASSSHHNWFGGRFDQIIEVKIGRGLFDLAGVNILYRDGKHDQILWADSEKENKMTYYLMYLATNR